jgi:hypothetical protein
MESISTARRTEDIVASQANVGSKSSGSTGFGLPSSPKGEDQVTHLLELYARCREAVEAPVKK